MIFFWGGAQWTVFKITKMDKVLENAACYVFKDYFEPSGMSQFAK